MGNSYSTVMLSGIQDCGQVLWIHLDPKVAPKPILMHVSKDGGLQMILLA